VVFEPIGEADRKRDYHERWISVTNGRKNTASRYVKTGDFMDHTIPVYNALLW
jgi:hypothetical protein